jgi:hypothetical protein
MKPIVRHVLIVVAVGATLAGCTSAEQLAKRDQERCSDRGLAPNSDLYANCLLQLEGERSNRMEQRRRENLEKPFDPTTVTQGR